MVRGYIDDCATRVRTVKPDTREVFGMAGQPAGFDEHALRSADLAPLCERD